MVSAVLKEGGHDTRLYADCILNQAHLDGLVEDFKPGLVGVHVTYPQSGLAQELATYLATKHSLPVVYGGVWPTTMPEKAIETPDIIGLARGEAEYSMLDLANAMQDGKPYMDLEGFWFRRNGEVVKNPPREYIMELDAMPFPDREIFADQPYMNRLPYLEFIGSRGCPFQCSNCFHHSWRNHLTGNKHYVRFKSPARLIAEIKDTLAKYPRKGEPCIGFHDATFTLNRKWTLETCELLKKEIDIPWWCNTRASNLDEELADALKAGGCFEVHVGIESGDPKIRNDVLRKKVTNEQIVNAFKMLKDRDMYTFGFNMLGLPYETEEAILRTVDINRQVQPDTIFCSVFNPFPGTDLYDMVIEKGWLSDRQVESYFNHDSVLDQPSVDHKLVAHYHKFFKLMVKKPWLAALLRPLDRIHVGGHTVYDYIDHQFGAVGVWRKRLSRTLPRPVKRILKRTLGI